MITTTKKGMQHAILLSCIVCLAAILRFSGISFGLPYTYHWDELAVINRVVNLAKGHPNPHWFFYPTGFMYLQAVAVDALYAFGRVVGWWHSTRQFQTLFHTDPTKIFLVVRFLSATMGVASVWLVYKTSRLLGSGVVSYGAAALTAICPLLVRDSHFGVMDVPASFCCIAGTFFLVLYIQKKKPFLGYLSALIVGLAVGTKWTAVFMLPVLVYAIYVVSDSKKSFIRTSFVLLGVMIMTCFLVSPFAFLDINVTIYQLKQQRFVATEAFGPWQPPAPIYFMETGLRWSFGWTTLICSIMGVATLIHRRPAEGWLLAVFVLSFGASVVGSRGVFDRYLDPVLPILCLMAAVGLDAISEYTRTRITTILKWRQMRMSAFMALLISISVPLLATDIVSDRLFGRVDTRSMAKDWIVSNLPSGTVLASTSIWGDPQLVNPDSAKWFRPAQKTYSIIPFNSQDATLLSSFLAEQHIEYLIATDYPGYDRKGGLTPPTLRDALPGKKYLKIVHQFSPITSVISSPPLLETVDAWYIPLANGFEVNRPGPRITLWKVIR